MTTFLGAAAAGLGTGAGLIVAIGPQNVYVLQQGVRRTHTAAIVAVCAISDLALIIAGVAGLGALVAAHPDLVTAAKLLGGAYVIVLGVLAARRSSRGAAAIEAAAAQPMSRWTAIGTALVLTWLNPHVYLDTVLTLGAIASGHGDGRWAFAAGAGLASVLWFAALGHGAGRLSGFFSSPRAWRALDAVVAVIMIALGAALILSI
ncbi:LysE/ArgO family amino acid transporter [Gordonia sp. ABSL1-1]|uniref:LysE/ArgO family amino acid transporter n=1 Tax=Gordonia sp. ABSL1-1 TaxID=3053923 RepID=UPI002572D3DE|nr:LysE/ArgO family amino acid transporter [Gordonia sp. ABSL1-1]MDL9935195.1 LysE/ArgO family amino acid transporter [Gordonia sp. ABSL1-1]